MFQNNKDGRIFNKGISDSKNGKIKVQEGKLVKRTNTLDEGVIAFGEWLASIDDKEVICGSLSLRKFVANSNVLILDKQLGKEISVEFLEGVPQCNVCTDTDCIHIGFSICVSQKYRRNGMVNLT